MAVTQGQCWKSGYRARAIKEELKQILASGSLDQSTKPDMEIQFADIRRP